MAIFEKLGIKIPNGVLIDGLTDDNFSEVVDFLEQYGEIHRKLIVDCAESEFYEMFVVEYVS